MSDTGSGIGPREKPLDERPDTYGPLDRLHAAVETSQLDRAMEYVTFGRRPRMILRVWLIQVIFVFADVGVFGMVHPFFEALFHDGMIQEAYLVMALVFGYVLWSYLSKMGQLTYATRFHRRRYQVVSATCYLVLGASIVAITRHIMDLTPGVTGPHLALDLAMSAMLTTGLAAMLAIAFYLQFDATKFTPRRRSRQTIADWLTAQDWAELPEGSSEKDRRYIEFEKHTEDVAECLEDAMTDDGVALREDFDEWRQQFQRYSLLTKERIVAGDVRNSELQAQNELLESLNARLALLTDNPRSDPDNPRYDE